MGISTEGGEQFDEADETAVTVLADWAAIAIENARLYTSLEQRSGELERAVVKRARALVEARSLLVFLREQDELVLVAAAGQVSSGARGDVRVPISGSTAGEVLQSERPRRIDDVEQQLRFPSERLGVADASVALLVPLVYRGRALGVLAAFDRLSGEESFTDDDEQVLRAFAASAATAVATARTVEADRLRHSLDAAESERRRWARELHDETLQALGGLNVLVKSAARSDETDVLRGAIRDATEHVSREIENLRSIITELRPAALDELGLEPALTTLATRVATSSGLEVETDIDIDARLPGEQETAAYRIVQEALSNVVKHAEATTVNVSVATGNGELRIAVADDGRGFDPSASTGGFGLLGMRERIDLAGGRLAIEPNDPGTRVEVTLPAHAGP